MNVKPQRPLSVILFLVCTVLLMLMMPAAPVQACQHDSSQEAAENTAFQVIVGPLRIRDTPGGNVIGVLLVGQTVAISEYAESGDYLWGRHGLGWSALHTIDCAVEYTQHTDAAPDVAAPADDAAGDGTAGDGAPADDAAAPPAAPPAGGDNLCHTVWTFCNSGTPAQNDYFWRLGFFASAVQKGEFAGDPRELVEGRAPQASPPSPEATAEP